MADDALELVRLRNNFYRDNYRRAVLALLLLILVNIGLGGIIAYLVTHRPAPQYFATTADGKIIPIYALSEPVVNTADLLQWATQAATAVFTYNFVNWRDELQRASENFTPEGWKNFQDALERSRNLELIISKKLVSSAVATGAPVVLEQGILGDRYAWKIQVPVLITYESANYRTRQSVLVTMLVTRVSTLNNPKGIAISAFYSTEKPINPSESL
jgi:intracellular multiplication protein IcmL